MKLLHLINNTYQVVTDDEQTVLFQGGIDNCKEYMLNQFSDKMTITPELLDVFKRLAGR